MPIIGSYSVGGNTQSTLSYNYSTLDELLTQLPNNTSNLINAQDIRDAVFTLWDRINNVAVVASQSASASVYYTNAIPVPVTIGGITLGTTFSNASMTDMWNALLYPYIAPSVLLLGGDTREFGSTNVVTLSWFAYKNTNSLTSIIVDSVPILGAPFNSNQSGVQLAVATQDVNTTFYMSTSDGTSTPSTSTSVSWVNRRYWGTLSVGHPLVSASSATFSHIDITTLSNELGNGYIQTRTITTNYDYVVFIWPNNAVDLSTNPPHVKIGGFGNNNWVKTRNNVQFTNQWGYTGTNYDVWVFGNTQAPNTFTYEIT